MRSTKRWLALILTLAVVISGMAMTTLAGAATSGQEIVVIAGSDFQNRNGDEAGGVVISNIFNAMEADGITKADGLLFCGDYDYASIGNAAETVIGVNAFKGLVKDKVDEESLVLVQGNHDVFDGSGFNPSGNNDPQSGEYGVFVIHNKDYMWYNNNEAIVKQTAQMLMEYLNEKLAEGFDKPIFVVSHLPLHYSMRTKNDGDARYANYLFNILNEAGEKGLNLFFLYGHDHSNGWDDYLGGSAVYLPKGDEILIAQASRTEFKSETLNFTYVNAGYVGYYDKHNGGEDTLSMTAFRIKDNQVTVARYDENGKHTLKSAGVKNSYKNESGYDPNTKVYESPQVVKLTAVTDNTPIQDFVTGEGRQYTCVDSIEALESGEKYLLVYAGSSKTFVMLPSVVTKGNSPRTGFDLQEVSDFGGKTAYSELADEQEFTLTSKDTGWLLGNGQQNTKLTQTSSTGVTATFEDEGDVFTLAVSNGVFTFQSGGYVLNYNESRGLINGYASGPASFYIYRFTGSSVVSVENGEAQVDGKTATLAGSGTTVTLIAKAAPEGKEFDKWDVLSGDVTLSDANSATSTFVMPAIGVKIAAVYKTVHQPEKDPTSSNPTESSESDSPNTGDVSTPIVASVLFVIAAIGMMTLKKKKVY